MSDLDSIDTPGQARPFRWSIPEELCFEQVIKNRTAPPCSLSDFMDYLLYVEHNAEPLQFFLWYCDYVQRWSSLLPRQKALSPAWDPESAAEPPSRFITYSHRRARSLKMSKIITIMEMGSEQETADPNTPESRRSTSSSSSSTNNFSRPRTSSSSSVLSPTESSKGDWQPFTIQPFRDELTRIIRHYIALNSPRQLSPAILTPADRATCVRAAARTTHPSALLPAFLAAEASLRGSHGRFVRWLVWTSSNPSPARVCFLRCLSAALILAGLALDVLLILSRLPPHWRVVCLALWWPAWTVLFAALAGVRPRPSPWAEDDGMMARKGCCLSWGGGGGGGGGGMCVVLHFRGLRQLRPWEQHQHQNQNQHQQGVGDCRGTSAVTKDGLEEGSRFAELKRIDTDSSISPSSSGRVDPLCKPSLQVFGPRNDFSGEPWVEAYSRKSWWRKVFDDTVPVQNKGLVLMQDRTLLLSVLWAGVVSSVLTVGSLFVPKAGLF